MMRSALIALTTLFSLISSFAFADLAVGDRVLYEYTQKMNGESQVGSAERTVLKVDTGSITYSEKIVIDGKESVTELTVKLDDLGAYYNTAYSDAGVIEALDQCESLGGKNSDVNHEDRNIKTCAFSQFFNIGGLITTVVVGPFPFGFYSTTFEAIFDENAMSYKFVKQLN